MPENLPADPASIFMWRRIDSHLTTSGQPTEEQLVKLKAIGVTHVVNLALHSHVDSLADEGGSLRGLGIEYVNIPVDFDRPGEDDFARFRAVMDGLEGKTVHVHCIANLRVSAFLYRYRRNAQQSESVARGEMESIWRPGGVWARFIGDDEAEASPHRFAGKDY
jgi:protein tyrosine phosphatase (PTP) superfamily phosphohydrolase (DUF442 family)